MRGVVTFRGGAVPVTAFLTLCLSASAAMLALSVAGPSTAAAAAAADDDGRIYFSHLSDCSFSASLCNTRIESVRKDGSGFAALPCTLGPSVCLSRFVTAAPWLRGIAVATDDPEGSVITVLRSSGRIHLQIRPVEKLILNDLARSPDGKRFVANEAAVSGSRIVVIDQRGRTRRVSRSDYYDVAWSRRGVVGWSNDGLTGTMTLRAGSGGETRFPIPGRGITFSPSGKSVAFVRPTGTFVASLAGAKVERVSKRCSSGAADLTWSPSGRYLACVPRGGGVAVVDVRRKRTRTILVRRVTSIAWARG